MELVYQKNPQENIFKETHKLQKTKFKKRSQESTLKEYEQKYNKEWQLQMTWTYRLMPASSTTYYTRVVTPDLGHHLHSRASCYV